mmetsp:Transcript_7030/g.24392  ORF Transcript_7030/g.24392 Transcript_7030/m.24392 type:complete len:329 (-) Transcript_7030:259-1245(-)
MIGLSETVLGRVAVAHRLRAAMARRPLVLPGLPAPGAAAARAVAVVVAVGAVAVGAVAVPLAAVAVAAVAIASTVPRAICAPVVPPRVVAVAPAPAALPTPPAPAPVAPPYVRVAAGPGAVPAPAIAVAAAPAVAVAVAAPLVAAQRRRLFSGHLPGRGSHIDVAASVAAGVVGLAAPWRRLAPGSLVLVGTAARGPARVPPIGSIRTVGTRHDGPLVRGPALVPCGVAAGTPRHAAAPLLALELPEPLGALGASLGVVRLRDGAGGGREVPPARLPRRPAAEKGNPSQNLAVCSAAATAAAFTPGSPALSPPCISAPARASSDAWLG